MPETTRGFGFYVAGSVLLICVFAIGVGFVLAWPWLKAPPESAKTIDGRWDRVSVMATPPDLCGGDGAS